MSPSLSLTVNSSGESVASAIAAALSRRGFFVLRSFDLRSALAAHVHCECPHHGTAQCTCQYVVLQVFDDPGRQTGYNSGRPVVVTVHGHDERSFVQVVADAAAQPDPTLVEQVLDALLEFAFDAPSAGD